MIPGSINYLADVFSRAFSKESAKNLPKIKFPLEMNAKVL